MPTSMAEGKSEVLAYIQAHVPPAMDILDVGPGAGTWVKLLGNLGYRNVDAVEIFERYVTDYTLKSLYRNVIVGDICAWSPAWYDCIILGDVLEHIDVERAVPLVERLGRYCSHLIVCVPWTYPQGECHGNPFERHHQADLTPAIMHDRYPTLRPLHLLTRNGIYVHS